jgi:hypothetical protein
MAQTIAIVVVLVWSTYFHVFLNGLLDEAGEKYYGGSSFTDGAQDSFMDKRYTAKRAARKAGERFLSYFDMLDFDCLDNNLPPGKAWKTCPLEDDFPDDETKGCYIPDCPYLVEENYNLESSNGEEEAGFTLMQNYPHYEGSGFSALVGMHCILGTLLFCLAIPSVIQLWHRSKLLSKLVNVEETMEKFWGKNGNKFTLAHNHLLGVQVTIGLLAATMRFKQRGFDINAWFALKPGFTLPLYLQIMTMGVVVIDSLSQWIFLRIMGYDMTKSWFGVACVWVFSVNNVLTMYTQFYCIATYVQYVAPYWPSSTYGFVFMVQMPLFILYGMINIASWFSILYCQKSRSTEKKVVLWMEIQARHCAILLHISFTTFLANVGLRTFKPLALVGYVVGDIALLNFALWTKLVAYTKGWGAKKFLIIIPIIVGFSIGLFELLKLGALQKQCTDRYKENAESGLYNRDKLEDTATCMGRKFAEASKIDKYEKYFGSSKWTTDKNSDDSCCSWQDSITPNENGMTVYDKFQSKECFKDCSGRCWKKSFCESMVKSNNMFGASSGDEYTGAGDVPSEGTDDWSGGGFRRVLQGWGTSNPTRCFTLLEAWGRDFMCDGGQTFNNDKIEFSVNLNCTMFDFDGRYGWGWGLTNEDYEDMEEDNYEPPVVPSPCEMRNNVDFLEKKE